MWYSHVVSNNQTEIKMKTIEEQNAEARQFAIAQLKAVMDAETAARKASAKLHAEKEAAAALLDGGRDWSKQ